MSTSSVDGGGEEDNEDSSSSKSLNDLSKQFHSALDEFRDKWQKELKSDKKLLNELNDKVKAKPKDKAIQIEDDEKRAKEYFNQGIEHEKRGKVYDALHFYRRAIQIVPDIEFRIYEKIKSQQKENIKVVSDDITNNYSGLSHNKYDDDDDDVDEDLSNVDLRARFELSLSKNNSKLIERNTANEFDIISEAHISDLPMEIILYILRWVVSSQLDIRSLEQCAAVCKGLYLCARDEEIWKSACLKIWGVNTGLLKNSSFTSWRQMFIERHRVNFNGCYISKTSYLRYGENSFQDQFYRPVQLIEYYRYIRFLPDGTVVMLTSADEPSQCVGKLSNINQLRNDVLKGHYRLHGDIIIIMLKRYQKTQNTISNYNKKRLTSATSNNAPGFGNDKDTDSYGAIHTLYIELKILSTSKRRFCQLQWKNYSIIQYKNKKEISTDFELTTAKYPPLWFSRVKSYHLESEIPLK